MPRYEVTRWLENGTEKGIDSAEALAFKVFELMAFSVIPFGAILFLTVRIRFGERFPFVFQTVYIFDFFSAQMGRQRKPGEFMRNIDEETRRLIANARLQQLERDQAASAVDAVGIDNDVWLPSDESDGEKKSGTRRKSNVSAGKLRVSAVGKGESLTTRGHRRTRKTIEMVLMDEPLALSSKDTFLSVEVPAASSTLGCRPPFKLCSVCSYLSAYKCVRCGANFCSLACNGVHRDTKCLKFAD